MLVPQPFGMLPESSIASYDFTEFTSNLGYVAFYPYLASGSYLTTNNSIYASQAVIGPTPTECSFAVTFNRSAVIGGPAVVNILLGQYNGNAMTSDNVVSFYKNNTLIASGASITTPSENTGGAFVKTKVLTWNIEVPSTTMGKGDIFTMRVSYTNTGNGTLYLGADPVNRSWADIGFAAPTAGPDLTRSTALIPFRIDL